MGKELDLPHRSALQLAMFRNRPRASILRSRSMLLDTHVAFVPPDNLSSFRIGLVPHEDIDIGTSHQDVFEYRQRFHSEQLNVVECLAYGAHTVLWLKDLLVLRRFPHCF